MLSLRPDWGELSEVSELDEDVVLEALREATTVRLIAADHDQLRWQHTLTREVVLATLLPPERAASPAVPRMRCCHEAGWTTRLPLPSSCWPPVRFTRRPT